MMPYLHEAALPPFYPEEGTKDVSLADALKTSVDGRASYEKVVKWHCDCYGADLKNTVTSVVRVNVVAMNLV